MRKLLVILLVLSFLFLSVSAAANQAFAQVFKLELAAPSVPIASGSSFQVKVLINSGGKQVMGGDAIINFDKDKLGINSAQNGGFFSSFQDSPIGGSANKYLLSGWEISEAYAKTAASDTLFATTNMTAKANGSSTLSFDCTSGTTDSNIWDTTQKDIINCSSSLPITINIGGSSTPSPTLKPGPTSTPAATPTRKPTNTPIPTNTPRPTVETLPRSGTTEITIGILGIGALLTVMGILIIL